MTFELFINRDYRDQWVTTNVRPKFLLCTLVENIVFYGVLAIM